MVFDLTKQITILHGNNGFGKSSFFDAIEWCITNNIDRYNGTDTEIKRDIINRNCDLNNLKVSVEIEFGGNKLTRSFKVKDEEIKNTQVVLTTEEGVYRGQENVERFLKKDNFKDVDFDKFVYGQLIKQTYILSQDQVTDFVNSEDANGRYRALANIMGLKSMLNETDNAKKILTALKAKEKEIEIDIEKHNSAIQSKKEVMRSVDIYLLNSKLNQLGINYNNYEDECILEEKLINERNQNKKFLKMYEELELGDYISIEAIQNQIIQLEKSENNHRNKIKKREELISKFERQLKGLEEEKENLNKFNQLRLDIRENEEKLNKLAIKEKNIEEINLSLELLRGKASKYEYQLSIRKSLTENEQIIKDLDSEKITLQTKFEKLNRKEKKLTIIERKLFFIVDSSKNKIMAQLLSNIKDIKTYVGNNNLSQCPVCSSIPEQNLEENIDKNIMILNTKVQNDTIYLEKSMNLLKKIERKLDEIISEKKKISLRTERINFSLQRLTEELKSIKLNALYDIELQLYSEKELEYKLNEIQNKISSLQASINILLKLNELYEKSNNIVGFNNKKEITSPRKEWEVEMLLDRFILIKERILKRISNNQDKIEEIKTGMKKLESIVLRVKEYTTLESHSKNFSEVFISIHKIEKKMEETFTLLSNVKKMKSDLKINGEIRDQIDEINKIREIEVKKKSKIEKIIEVLDKHLQQKTKELGNEAKDFLNRDDSSIQRFFRYLNPLPSNSNLIFEGLEEELNIKIDFVQENSRNKLISNAKNVLSSGQLNVLAISIFLAINEGQKTHPLEFVAIDDPIQNMDDVNQYSICDVLGSIDKQLIISTHDLEFLKLFVKKNEHRKEDIQVYSFSSPYLNKEKINKIIFS